MKYVLLSVYLCLSVWMHAQEICNNGVDDDGDALVDLNDPDCNCSGISIFTPESLFPNPSFEELTDPDCGPGTAKAGCAAGWLSPSDLGTPDYGKGCDNPISVFLPKPPCPIPNGDHYFGIADYDTFQHADTVDILKEYVGTRLITPLTAGQTYVLSFWVGSVGNNDRGFQSGASTFTVFGNTRNNAMPFKGYTCPTQATVDTNGVVINPWQIITNVELTAEFDRWKQYEVEFTPGMSFSSILLGPECAAGTGKNYYFFDNIVLSRKEEFTSEFIQHNGAHACSGDLELSVPTDMDGLDYQWYKDGVAISGATNHNYLVEAPPVGAGSYICVVSNELGCSPSAPFEVVAPSAAPIISGPTGICPSETHILQVAADYDTYTWSHTAEKSPMVDIDAADTYIVTVSDVFGCIYSDTTEVVAFSDVVFTEDIQPTSTPSAQDGQITIDFDPSHTGGTVIWGDGRQDNPRTDLSAGRHCIQVIATNACTVDICLDVPVAIQPLSIDEIITPVRCHEEENGRIQVTVSGGRAPLTWSWSHDAPDDSPMVENLAPGDYTISINDADGRTLERTYTIHPVTPIITEVDIQRPSCHDQEDGRVRVLNTSGGHGDYRYQWNDDPISTNQSLNNLSEGQVMLTVIDAQGCTWNRQYMVDAPAPLSAKIDMEHAACTSIADGAIYVEDIKGGTPAYTLTINGENTDPFITDLEGDQFYTVGITDVKGCTYEQRLFLSYLSEFNVSLIGPSQSEQFKTLIIESAGSQPIADYEWSSTEGSTATCEDCPIFSIEPSVVAPLSIQVMATSIDGCIAYDTLEVQITPSKQLYIPTAISPNRDGINDGLEILNAGFVSHIIDLQVLNSQGNKVFHGTNGDLDRMLQSLNQRILDEELPTGVYVYLLQVAYQDGSTDQRRGEFMIVR